MKIYLVAALATFITIGCSSEDPTARRFKNGEFPELQPNGGGGAAGAVGPNAADPNAVDPDAVVDDPNAVEAAPVETPEQKAAREAAEAEALRVQSVAAGKVVFDTMCTGCHGAAVGGTLNARAPALIAAEAGRMQHNQIVATFQNAVVAAQVIDFLLDANGMVAAASAN